MRALLAFVFSHRWKGQLAEVRRLLATDQPPAEDVGPKLDAWLDSIGWEVRNAALKLIVRLRDEARYPRLVEKLADRSEAGIVRRNAAELIARAGLRTAPARAALRKGLNDPYWEVRAESARALAALFPPDPALEQDLLDLLYGYRGNGGTLVREDNFEVRMAIAEGLGHLGTSPAALAALRQLADDESWPVRSQAAVAIAQFASRHRDVLPEARDCLHAIDRQSEGAVSYFVHRDVLSQAFRALRKDPDALAAEDFRRLYLNPKAGWNHVRR